MCRLILLLALLSGCAGNALSGASPIPISRVNFTPRVWNNIWFLYDHVQADRDGVEVVFCLTGEIRGDTVFISGLELPSISRSDSVSFVLVDDDTQNCKGIPKALGLGHSHPLGRVCEFSSVDWNTFRRFGHPLGFLICEGRRFRFYEQGRDYEDSAS